jgi:hypothetical protein
MLAPSGPLNEIDFHVEVRGDLLIITAVATQFYAIYAKPSQPQLILRSPSPGVDELLGCAWQAANTKARELGWINGAPTEADALLR